MPPNLIGPLKKDSENRLETTAALQAGTATIGAISNTSFNQGAVSDHGRWMQGLDYTSYILRYVSVNSAGKLETVSIIEGGTVNVGDIERIGTIGYIEHLGSIANTEFDIGTVGRVTKVDALGSVTNVSLIDHLGTVGRLETIGMIEAGTISEVGHVGTVGDITHLGSIGNTTFDQGAVSDHERHMYAYESGTWTPVHGVAGGAHVLPGLLYAYGTFIYAQCNAAGELRTAPGYYAGTAGPLLTDSDYRLKTAPATTRKGGKKLVTNMGTAVALVASSTPCISVIVKALHANAGEIYVGDNTVGSATGYPLRKDEFVSFSCDNVNGVYIDRDAGTQGVSFLYVNY